MFHVPEKYRIKTGELASDESYGNNGAFAVKYNRTIIFMIASDGMEWEHVSAHCVRNGKQITPSWEEMCLVKSFFWDTEDCVVQYHPSKSEYVNMHENTLHLWRPINQTIPIPDKIMVGI